MRTTLDIEDDLLVVAKGIAKHQSMSLGKAVSLLLRKAIHPPEQKTTLRNGLRVIVRSQDATPVTLDIVNKFRDE